MKNLMQASRVLPAVITASVLLVSCTDGGGDDAVAIDPNNPPPAAAPVSDLPTATEAARFLSMATFGPTLLDIDNLTRVGYSAWIKNQFDTPTSEITNSLPVDAEADDSSNAWWMSAVYANDQLRQRTAFALSQIFVISASDRDLAQQGHAFGEYMDSMQQGAFGLYRDILDYVTYSPAMGIYLTYLGNEKSDPNSGSVPDENYAREVMQLFTIGVLELNPDGTLRLDGNGEPIETYDNTDITELAKVFTGLWWDSLEFGRDRDDVTPAIQRAPMQMNDEAHSTASKTFLDMTIPANTPGEQSIAMALDHLMDHPNTTPYLARQLIQRFVTSNPTPGYVERVAAAFAAGAFILPDGSTVGTGQRGDMKAVIAAVLLDEEALDPNNASDPNFGKVREPIIRFAHWARAFSVNSVDATSWSFTRNLSRSDRLNQQPYNAPSVFNFFRPGYVAPGTSTASAGLVAPELQIADSNSVIGYANFMETLVRQEFDGNDDIFVPDYSEELTLVNDPSALIDRLDLVLTAGRMRDETKARIETAMAEVTNNDPAEQDLRRVHVAVLMTVTSPEYLVQF